MYVYNRVTLLYSRDWHSIINQLYWSKKGLLTTLVAFDIQFSSVAQVCLNLCNPVNCSMPGLPVHHQLPKFTPTHVHWVGDAIQPSHPLSSPSSPAFNLSRHHSLFLMNQLYASGGQSIAASASVLLMSIQDWFPLGLTDSISLQSKWLWSLLQHHNSKASILQYSAFFMVNSHIHTWLLEKS